jgi:hypothetical protein
MGQYQRPYHGRRQGSECCVALCFGIRPTRFFDALSPVLHEMGESAPFTTTFVGICSKKACLACNRRFLWIIWKNLLTVMDAGLAFPLRKDPCGLGQSGRVRYIG